MSEETSADIEKTRTAVLYDEDGVEIFRGSPSDLPIRFIDLDGAILNCTMREAACGGVPADEDGDELEIHDAD